MLHPMSQMPKSGENWPTVDYMVGTNQRLVAFSSKSSKEASEGIAYQWNYLVETQCKSNYPPQLLTEKSIKFLQS